MKYLFLLLFALTSCYAPAPEAPKKLAALEVMLDETVALVNESEQTYCAGTWVAENKVLTAFHCVRNIAPDPTGYYIRLRFRNGKHEGARIAKIVPDFDLALLMVDDPEPHPSTHFSGHSVGQGTWTIGHPISLGNWTYFRGKVDTDDYVFSPNTHVVIPIIKTTSPAFPGNSGGGLFNDYGELIGVCSMHQMNAESSGLFIPLTPEITALL